MIKRKPASIPRVVLAAAVVLLSTLVFEGVRFFHGGITSGAWKSTDLPEVVDTLRTLSGFICLFYFLLIRTPRQLARGTDTLPIIKSNIYSVLLFLFAIFWLVAKINSHFSTKDTIAVQVAEILFPTYLVGYLLLACLNQRKQAESLINE